MKFDLIYVFNAFCLTELKCINITINKRVITVFGIVISHLEYHRKRSVDSKEIFTILLQKAASYKDDNFLPLYSHFLFQF